MRIRLTFATVVGTALLALAPDVASAQDTDPPPSGVAAAVTAVEYLVSRGELNEGQANALLGKLEQIQAYLAAGDTKRASQAADAFCNQVRAHVRAGHIAAATGDGMIAAAQAAIP